MNTEEFGKRKKRPNGKKRDAVSLIALALMLILVLYVFTCRVQGDLPYLFNKAFVRITSGSMEPTIPTDSYIIVRRLTWEEASSLKKDDIIIFTVEQGDIAGKFNTHRIYSVNDDGTYTTIGDYNVKPDDYTVRPDQVLGMYVKNADRLTRAYNECMEHKMLLIASAAMLLLAYFVICTASDMMQKKHADAKAIAASAVEQLKKDDMARHEIEERVKKELERLRAEGNLTDLSLGNTSDNPCAPDRDAVPTEKSPADTDLKQSSVSESATEANPAPAGNSQDTLGSESTTETNPAPAGSSQDAPGSESTTEANPAPAGNSQDALGSESATEANPASAGNSQDTPSSESNNTN